MDTDAKNIVELLLGRMLGISGKLSNAEEFRKAGIVPKTIRLLPNGMPKESMSFPAFDFIETANGTWEGSDLYLTLSSTKFMFVIFQSEYTDDPAKAITDLRVAKGKKQAPPARVTDYIFKRIMFWNMPADDLDEVRKVWERTSVTIRNGVELIQTERGVTNDLPKSTESPVAHVRPHGKNAADKLPLPDGRMMTKQCFWLNSGYIAEQIKTAE